MIKLLFGQAPVDAGVPYKLVERRLWDDVAPMIDVNSWIPSVLLAVALQKKHPRQFREIVVTHLARRGGRSTLRLGRLARFCVQAAMDLAKMKKYLAGKSSPPQQANARIDQQD